MAIGTPFNVGSVANKSTAESATSFTTTSAVSAGDTVFLHWHGTSSVVGGSDIVVSASINGNAMVKLGGAGFSSGSGAWAFFYLQNAPAMASGVTVTATYITGQTSPAKAIVCWACSGLATSGGPAQWAGRSLAQSQFDSGSITTTTPVVLLTGSGGQAMPNTITITQPTGFLATTSPYGPPAVVGTTGGSSTGNRCALGGYQITSVTGSYNWNPTSTAGGTGNSAVIAAWLAAAAGAPILHPRFNYLRRR